MTTHTMKIYLDAQSANIVKGSRKWHEKKGLLLDNRDKQGRRKHTKKGK